MHKRSTMRTFALYCAEACSMQRINEKWETQQPHALDQVLKSKLWKIGWLGTHRIHPMCPWTSKPSTCTHQYIFMYTSRSAGVQAFWLEQGGWGHCVQGVGTSSTSECESSRPIQPSHLGFSYWGRWVQKGCRWSHAVTCAPTFTLLGHQARGE